MIRILSAIFALATIAAATLPPEALLMTLRRQAQPTVPGFVIRTNDLYFWHWADSWDSSAPTNGQVISWWHDNTGNGHYATNSSAKVLWTNRVLRFGIGQGFYRYIAGTPSLDFTRNATNGLTVLAHVKLAWTGTAARVLWVASVGAANNTRYGLAVGDGGNRASLWMRRLDTDPYRGVHGGTLTTSEWHTIAATYATNGQAILYLDGIEVGRSNVLHAAGPTEDTRSYSQWIGTFNGLYNFTGLYYAALGYRATLTSNEIYSLHTNLNYWRSTTR